MSLEREGGGGDNVRLGDDGKVYRLDNGGALRFRARGSKKGDSFGGKVGELDSLRGKNTIFADISNEEIVKQAWDILKKSDEILDVIDSVAVDLRLPEESVIELKEIIKKRLADLQRFVESMVKPPKEKKTDKGIYESVVTNNYLDGWDEELDLVGNAEIKDQIRKNIIYAEKRNEKTYEDAAADLGISVEEFKARLQVKVDDMVDRANFFRATNLAVLEAVMNVDGRWKSQFETVTSNGSLNPRSRAAEEMNMFGFNKAQKGSEDAYVETWGGDLPDDVIKKDKEMRPIYGYFSDDEHGGINSENGKIPPPTNVIQYGNINFKIKKERALRKATITFHDSLGAGKDWPPTPASKPHFSSFRVGYYSGRRILNDVKVPSVVNWGESYTEVQYHGQLTMDDVDSIHVSTHNSLYQDDIEKVRRIFSQYKARHPESTVQLIEF